MTAYTSLPAAVRAAIDHGNTLIDIKPSYWAQTYRCTTEDVKLAWEAALTELTRKPINTYEVEGK